MRSNFEALSCYQIRSLPSIPFDKLKSLSLLLIIMCRMMSDFEISLKMTRFNVFIYIFICVLCLTQICRGHSSIKIDMMCQICILSIMSKS